MNARPGALMHGVRNGIFDKQKNGTNKSVEFLRRDGQKTQIRVKEHSVKGVNLDSVNIKCDHGHSHATHE